MRATTLLFFAYLTLSVAAYGTSGAYERLWYWYAYQFDQKTTIAPNCPGRTKGVAPRCSFQEFIKYIDASDTSPNPATLVGAGGRDIDTSDVPNTIKALETGGWTGEYNPNKITPGASKVYEVMSKIIPFLEARIRLTADGDATVLQRRENVKQVTTMVAFLRGSEATPPAVDNLSNKGYTVATYMSDVSDSGLSVEQISASMTASRSGVDLQQIKDEMTRFQASDEGHTKNAQFAREAAVRFSDACRGG